MVDRPVFPVLFCASGCYDGRLYALCSSTGRIRDSFSPSSFSTVSAATASAFTSPSASLKISSTENQQLKWHTLHSTALSPPVSSASESVEPIKCTPIVFSHHNCSGQHMDVIAFGDYGNRICLLLAPSHFPSSPSPIDLNSNDELCRVSKRPRLNSSHSNSNQFFSFSSLSPSPPLLLNPVFSHAVTLPCNGSVFAAPTWSPESQRLLFATIQGQIICLQFHPPHHPLPPHHPSESQSRESESDDDLSLPAVSVRWSLLVGSPVFASPVISFNNCSTFAQSSSSASAATLCQEAALVFTVAGSIHEIDTQTGIQV